MAQFGKASSKRSKPSYIYSIVGVALVLPIFSVGYRRLKNYFQKMVTKLIPLFTINCAVNGID